MRDIGEVDKTVRAGGYAAKRIKAETVNGIDELHEARKRIRELEAALANSHMDYCLESAFLDIACGKLGISTEELKKRTL
jgi:hypothetical protein